jgi:hypothetical protein
MLHQITGKDKDERGLGRITQIIYTLALPQLIGELKVFFPSLAAIIHISPPVGGLLFGGRIVVGPANKEAEM